ncbi:MAG: hypothetical protein DRI61_12125 [Chloroflexi bacterium]|nr:MAG: hypothetical protein DRI61_12125 [Chloroflexota bacterium]
MQARKMGEHFIIRLEAGEEVVSTLKNWVEQQGIKAGFFWGLGALSRAELGYFDAEVKSYRRIPVEEQVEALSMIGNISIAEDGNLLLHIHVILGRADGRTLGGHFFEGFVYPTLEIILLPLPGTLQRRTDPVSGLQALALE